MAIQISVLDDFLRDWENPLLTLGVERCRLLWSEMGVPTAVIARPEPVAAACAPVLEAAAKQYGFTELRGTQLQTLLEAAFLEIAAHYGEDVAESVHQWVLSTFAGDASLLWKVWSIIFNGTARFAGRERFTAELLAEGMTAPERVVDIVEGRFGRATHATRLALLQHVREQPTPPFEARVRAVDIAAKAADPTHPGLYSALIGGLLNHQARRAWAELDVILTDEERALVLAWARTGMAKQPGFPWAAFLALPVRQAQFHDEQPPPEPVA